jgi:ABC-2 type transport system permease protein
MSGGYRAALAAEALKARRSKMPLLTFIAMSAAGLIAALFMFILVNPARAQRLGLLNEKAHLSGLTADWAGLLSFLAQIVAVGDLLLFSFITTWVFGREFSDGTMRYLLALPIPRSTIVYAKFTVVVVWSAAMNIWLAGIVLTLGWALGLPGASPHVVMHGLSGTAIAAVLMLLVTTPVALVACAGRGYLAALASAAGALILAQVAAALGWGGIFPSSIPAVAAGLAPGTRLAAPGIVIAVLTGLAGVFSTVTWWRSGRAGL